MTWCYCQCLWYLDLLFPVSLAFLSSSMRGPMTFSAVSMRPLKVGSTMKSMNPVHKENTQGMTGEIVWAVAVQKQTLFIFHDNLFTICFYCSRTVRGNKHFCCHLLNMCTSAVPQQVSLWNHNWCTVKSVWLERRSIVSYPHLPLWLMGILTYLRLCDHGGFAVTQGGKGEAELDLLISLEETVTGATQTRCVNGALKSAV